MTLNPRKLFLLDGFGALLSAFLLGVVLVRFENVFGMPKDALYFLAFLPCLFAAFDCYCYLKDTENYQPFLKTIAILNVLYCFISVGYVFLHYQQLTAIGWGYFLTEVLIVIILAIIELKMASK